MYQCIKQLYFACDGDIPDYLSRCISLLKSHKIYNTDAVDMIAMHITSLSDSAKIMDVLMNLTDINAPRKFCKDTLVFMEECGVHCDCGNCIHSKENKYRGSGGIRLNIKQSAENDRAVLSWCLLDRDFMDSLVSQKDFSSLIRTGLFQTKVYLIDEPKFSYSCPIYNLVMKYLREQVIYPFYYTRSHGNYYGLEHDKYIEIMQHLLNHTVDIPDSYLSIAQKTLHICLQGLDDPTHLINRVEALNLLNDYREGIISYEGETDGASPILAQAKEHFHALLNASPSLEGNSGSAQTFFKLPKEDLTCLYILDDIGGYTILEQGYITILQELFSGKDKMELPMELVIFEKNIYLLTLINEKYYLIPEDTFSPEIIEYVIPICFLPFGILSYFPNMRSIRSIYLIYITHFLREYQPGPLHLIHEILKKSGQGLQFQLSFYLELYRTLNSYITSKERGIYKEMVEVAVYRSGCYYLRHLVSPADQTVLFTHNGISYVYLLNLHTLTAMPGYIKYRVSFSGLRSGAVGELVRRLAHIYCSHSYFKLHPHILIGTIENRCELDFLVDIHECSQFEEFLHGLSRYADDLSNGKVYITVEEEHSESV